jgi:nucleotide-binding universal stress UspA family protein
VTPLSDALTAAQRSALAALEKAYVAGLIERDDAHVALETIGIIDHVDRAFLFSALDVLREWGVSAPTMSERVVEEQPATEKQLDYLRKLAEGKGAPVPDKQLTKASASEAINELQNGTYDPEKWCVPF